MVNLGSEQDLWWHHWVFIRQEELAIEQASLVWSLCWAGNLDEEVSVVLLIWLGIDSNNCKKSWLKSIYKKNLKLKSFHLVTKLTWILSESLSLLKH